MKRWFLMILVPLMATAVLAQTGAESVTPPPAVPMAPAPSSEPPPLPPSTAPAPKTPAKKSAPAKKKTTTVKKKATAQKPKAAASKSAPKTAAAPASSASKSALLDPPVPAIVIKENVNLRGRPSLTAGEVITKLKKGETVTVLEEITLAKPAKDQPAKWARVALPTGIPVWVSGEFVDPATKSISAKKLNFRAGPGENYSVLGRVTKGTPVTELRKNKGWIEIEAPTNAYAFVAANYLDKQSPLPPPVLAQNPPPAPAPAPAPAPVTPPEVVNVPADNGTIAAAKPETQPVLPPPSVEPVPAAVPAPAPAVSAPAPVEPAAPKAVAVAPEQEPDAEPPQDEPLPKRIVTHQGIVRPALNIQAPADFELHDAKTGELLNYLSTDSPDLKFKSYVDVQVMVTGEEIMDRRWQRTPILQVETIETP